jgi:hypothetical protein
MTDDEPRLARTLARHLDLGAAAMRPGTVYRLQQARARALAGVERVPAAGAELAAAGPGGASGGRFGRAGVARWLGMALLVAAIGFGYQQWHSAQQVREFEDLDLHLLASDLPIDAYLDRGFQNWLRATLDY